MWQWRKTKSEDVASISDPTIDFYTVLQDRFTSVSILIWK